jgi:hypothetical protein
MGIDSVVKESQLLGLLCLKWAAPVWRIQTSAAFLMAMGLTIYLLRLF